MTDPSRTPILVGVGQRSDRTPDLDDLEHPRDRIVGVVRAAIADAGGFDPRRIDVVATIAMHDWKARNHAAAIARLVGADEARSVWVVNGGEAGVRSANWLSQQIADGEIGLAVLTGGNFMRSLELARREGREDDLRATWEEGDDTAAEPEPLGAWKEGVSALETAAGMTLPPFIYPIFDNALRAHHGRSLQEHMEVVGRLMARFTDVAAANPYAWFPIARTAEELVTPSPTNRMVSYPYTKYLNAILNVDQCAALVLTSVERARELGISEDRWIYWWGGNHAKEEAWYASTRPDFASTPSILDSHLGALANAGTTLDDIDLIDFYSCFPAPVEMACKMLGLDLDDPRGFTITGGLPYAGGPGSSYTLHSLATMADRIRERPEAKALITGNGFYLTKHAASVWSGRPFEGEALRSVRSGPQPSEALDTAPHDPVPANGRGTIETYTVVYDRDGSPARGIVLGSLESGERFLANTPHDRNLLEAFVAEEQVGNTGRVTTGEGVSVYDPD